MGYRILSCHTGNWISNSVLSHRQWDIEFCLVTQAMGYRILSCHTGNWISNSVLSHRQWDIEFCLVTQAMGYQILSCHTGNKRGTKVTSCHIKKLSGQCMEDLMHVPVNIPINCTF